MEANGMQTKPREEKIMLCTYATRKGMLRAI